MFYSVQSVKYQPFVGSCRLHIVRVDVISQPQEKGILYRSPSEPKISHGFMDLFSQ